jgi:predicted transcriptional regulator
MKRLKRRPALLIYYEILSLLLARPMGPTRLAGSCNIAYDRMVDYLKLLEVRGFMRKEIEDGHEVYHLTPEGSKMQQDLKSVWARVGPVLT